MVSTSGTFITDCSQREASRERVDALVVEGRGGPADVVREHLLQGTAAVVGVVQRQRFLERRLSLCIQAAERRGAHVAEEHPAKVAGAVEGADGIVDQLVERASGGFVDAIRPESKRIEGREHGGRHPVCPAPVGHRVTRTRAIRVPLLLKTH
jgi:hypothetical protein